MSCLFDSLSKYLDMKSNEIRQLICDYLEKNNSILDGIDTNYLLNMENTNYVLDMRKRYTWGGAIEIKAACNIWGLQIYVHDCKNKKTIKFMSDHGYCAQKIKLCWNGTHYKTRK